MARKPITFRGFNKGLNVKGDCYDLPGIISMWGFKFGDRVGVLESRGGFDSWDTAAVDWTFINGNKRWYREDGGVNTFIFGTQNGGVRRLWYFTASNKSVTSLQQVTEIIDDDYAVEWVDCGSQLIVLPFGNIRPYSVKLNGYGDEGGIIVRQLGLGAPTEALTLSHTLVNGGIDATTGQFDTFKYCITYSYGTKSQPEKYGESGAGPVISNTLFPTSSPNDLQFTLGNITAISNPPGIIKKINIYRTKENSNTFYKVGEITEPGVTSFVDRLDDDLIGTAIGTGRILPTATGVATGIRCGMWHPGLKRFFWFGFDGYFHWSEPGFPDINPANNRMEVGNLGFNGNAIINIQNGIYCLKEDGIYIIQGDAPNYFSRKISPVKCVARSGTAELPDGFYFPGVESNKLKVYRFNGNNAVPISESLNALLPANKQSVYKRMYGKRVGDEYWLSLMVTDKRLCYYPVPFNNVILMYDYRFQEWSGSLPVQASSIDVWDGPGDSGEVFITESDPAADNAKGNIFRLEKRSAKVNTTDYLTTVRNYSIHDLSGNISVGILPGLNFQDKSLEKILGYSCKARVKGYLGFRPTAEMFEDDTVKDLVISTGSLNIDNLRENDLVNTGISSCRVGTGKVGHTKCVKDMVEDYEYTFIDILHRTGVALKLNLERSGKLVEVEAIETAVETTNNE